MRIPVSRGLRVTFVIALLAAAVATPASPSQSASSCDDNFRQVFLPWSDTAQYALTPGGSFEPGSPNWSLHGGAKVVGGNEHFYVHSSSDRHSLRLPKGSTARTPPICFGFTYWHVRLLASGTAGAKLDVKVHVKGALGVVSLLDGGTISVGSSWWPTANASLLLTNVGGLLTTDTISLPFTAVDGDVQIDDVYIDPWYNQ